MSFRLPIGLGQVLRHATNTPLKQQTIPTRFFSQQTQSIRSPTPSTAMRIQSPTLTRRHLTPSIPIFHCRASTPQSSSPSLLRSFSTTRQTLMRPNYFPRNSGRGSGGASPKPGFFRRMLISIERLPHTYIVRLPFLQRADGRFTPSWASISQSISYGNMQKLHISDSEIHHCINSWFETSSLTRSISKLGEYGRLSRPVSHIRVELIFSSIV